MEDRPRQYEEMVFAVVWKGILGWLDDDSFLVGGGW